MTTTNATLLLLSLLLQLALLFLLVRSRLTRHYIAFTALLSFYLVRTLLLFSLFGHLASPAYAMIYEVFALIDLLLQIAVAFSFFRASARPVRLPGRIVLFTVLTALAITAALALSSAINANPRSLLDRGVVFGALLIILTGLTAQWHRFDSLARRLMAGLMTIGIVAIATQVARTMAAYRHDAATFRLWSYTDAATYLMVLLFWVVSLAITRIPQARVATIVTS